MYGPGYGIVPPQPRRPSTTAVVVLRVVFTLLPLLSLGFLTWVTTLRLAIVTRKALDWVLFAVSLVVVVLAFILLPVDEVDNWKADVAIGGILLNAAVFTGYHLYADIRHHERRHAAPAPVTPYTTTYPRQATGYGYPQAQAPAQPAAPPPPQPQPQPQVQPQPQPQPQPEPLAKPQSQRIHQVRAELDELSDLLRNDPKDPKDPWEEGK
ncbi:hypothetical protein [Streptomyces sp. CB03238]|uniref:hypothetical protein n=1 Tax=Streptomyces sp. CB03238 TaxID=1907777 RepID=UPI000A10D90A|nr:hypothetical protein [Streptomyces sp. CB03238]ORT58484.1 hypothetical protein BKD26_17935 [Streptomyces sp. CB03238]